MPPRVGDDELESSVFFYPDQSAAESDSQMGGSGFIVGRPFPASGKDHVITWLVTNQHVIERGHWTVRINKRAGGFECIDTNEQEWFCHPDGSDLAIRPVALSLDTHKFRYLKLDWFLDERTANLYGIGPGDPCYVIGRFVNQSGKKQNTPTTRFGQIAQLPIEKVECDGVEQVSYLVEVRSIAGFSGSPVFVYLDRSYTRPHMPVQNEGGLYTRPFFETGPWLLGVDWCMVPGWDPVCDESGQELSAKWKVPANTGMMGVVPAWHLRWLLMEDTRVVALSKKIEEQELARRKNQPPPVVKTSSAPKKDDPAKSEENPLHKEDFKRLLEAAVKPPKSSD